MDVSAIKASLLGAPWRKYQDVVVPGRDGLVTLEVRRPPDGVLSCLMETAKEDGLIGTDGEERNPAAALRFRARLVAALVFLPNGVVSLFNEEEALAWPGIHDVADVCMAAINPAKALEKAKGN